jgi:hypothetical protein
MFFVRLCAIKNVGRMNNEGAKKYTGRGKLS